MTEPARAETGQAAELPVRVTTLELFFDLVFAFTLTQLSAVLAARPLSSAIPQVLLIFGLLWWMYGGYAWLTNARPPLHTPERIGLLLGMAGFLVVGLAIPHGFASTALAIGFGYLAVVAVHAWMYLRVNRNMIRVAPFNVASALLVIAAGLVQEQNGTDGPASYALWISALAVQLGSPLVVHPRSLFELRPAHFVERHSALLIVAIGESVAAIGIGGARLTALHGHGGRLVSSALLGLAVTALLWWIVFGAGDEERTERFLTEASAAARTELALSAFFYAFIPLLVGLIAMAAGLQEAVARSAGAVSGSSLTTACVLAAGAALFLAGNVFARRQLRLGPLRPRLIAAAGALATAVPGILLGLDWQLAFLIVLLVALLAVEARSAPRPASAGTDAAQE